MMDKAEASKYLTQKLTEYRNLSHPELEKRIDKFEHFELKSNSGANYQIEMQFFWDDEREKHIRVVGSIDDGGLRAYVPITDSFIKTPDGSFIDE